MPRFPAWGYIHVTVNHSEREYARDADGDGIDEVHVNNMEGVWSLLRSWLRPHRGLSQRFLPLYIGIFQAMHNTRQRGQQPSVLMYAVLDKKSLLSPLLALLLTSAPRNPGRAYLKMMISVAVLQAARVLLNPLPEDVIVPDLIADHQR